MHLKDFDFNLPTRLIAQKATTKRTASRLLVASNNIIDDKFDQLSKYLNKGDLLVLNDTKVIPARLYGKKTSGGNVEIMLDRITEDNSANALLRANKTPQITSNIIIADGIYAKVCAKSGYLYKLKFYGDEINNILLKYGHMPLPPYIKRADNDTDKHRYQNVFARHKGAVAAPTAGLHFDNNLLEKLTEHGINHTFITLHVGIGTFLPVKADNITEHKMHSERFDISNEAVAKIKQTKKNGNSIVAVGTTVARTLESVAKKHNTLKAVSGETDIFIYPGFEFKVIDRLITNFHLPKSSLLMLVSAFSGCNHIKKTYKHAIANNYRFFSYGDAMMLDKITADKI